VPAICGEKSAIEIDAPIAATEAPMRLEVDLRGGLEFGGEYQASHGRDRRMVEGSDDPLEPARVQSNVIVRVGDDVSPGCERTGIASVVETRPSLAKVNGVRGQRYVASTRVARRVVHDDHLGGALSLSRD
jgi:hypothetical protein